MRPNRLSVAALMALIALAACGMAALRSASAFAMWALLIMVAATFNGAALAALTTKGRERVVWCIFALIGGQYLILSLVPPLPGRFFFGMPQEQDSASPMETIIGRWADAVIKPDALPGYASATIAPARGRLRQVDPWKWDTRLRLVKIAHFLMAVGVGATASVVTVLILAARDRLRSWLGERASRRVGPLGRSDSASRDARHLAG